MIKHLDFPTPYGRMIKIFPGPGKDGSDAEDYVFDMDGAAMMAGIHDPVMRKRFCERAQEDRGIPIRIEDFGGHTVPHVVIPRPRNAISSTISKEAGADIPLHPWIDALFRHDMWFKRAKWIEETIDGNLDAAKDWSLPPEIQAIGLSNLLTAALEHMPEHEIDCIEAASWFALTSHDEWKAAGYKWLTPFKDTWFRDWIANRPGYRRFAALCRKIDVDQPIWIEGGAR